MNLLIPATALATLATFATVLLLQTASFRRTMLALAEDDVMEKTELAAEALSSPLARSDMAAVADFCAARQREGIRVTVVDADGTVLHDTSPSSGNHAQREEIRQALSAESGFSVRRSNTVGAYLLYGARRVGNRIVRLAVPYTAIQKPLRMARNGAMAAGVVGACTVLLIFIATRRMSDRLSEQARALHSAKANEKFRREFTANVAHELKTPLTAILGAAEMANDGGGLSGDERRELMDIIAGQCARLNAIVGDILALSQIEREKENDRSAFVPVPMEEIVAAAAAAESPRAAKAGVELAVTRNAAATVDGDPHLLEQAIVNLVENALRYSGSERVELSSLTADGRLVVSVTDFGIGIPPEHLPHLFERFYRVDKARSRKLGGTGLGLAIVKHIAQLHGGDVAVESTQGVSTAFSIVLPTV